MELSCLSRLRHKPAEELTLFPGLRLGNKVRQSQFAAQIVGDTFEKLTHVLVGPKWKRLYPENNLDVRPDLGCINGINFIESKANKDRRYFKVSAPQLRAYKELVESAVCEGRDLNLYYFLWSYCHDEPLSGNNHTIKDVVQMILNGIICLDIVDWTIMYAILQQQPKNTQYREYMSWRASSGNLGYRALQISQTFLARFRENSHTVISDELRLDPMEYDLCTNYRRRLARVTFDGIEFKTNLFKINRYILKQGVQYCPVKTKQKEQVAVPF